MDTTITIKDLAFFIIFCLVTTVGVFFIIMLYNLTNLIKRANKVIIDNSDNIDKTLELLPEAARNVNDVAVSVKGGMNKVGETIEGFEDAIGETAAAVSEGTENILNFVKIFSNIVQVIINAFNSSGKK